jgi:hypothetical protein
VRLLSLDLGGRQIRKALAQQHFDRADCGNITLPEWSRQSRFGRVGRSRQF